MPGPGGTGPAAQRVPAVGFIDPRLCRQQVLVAAFPELPPEVHMAFVDPARMVLSLREASTSERDGIGFGDERTILLTDIGSVQNNDGEVIVLGRNTQQLLQMHFEAPEDENIWARGLRAMIGDASMMANNQEEMEEEEEEEEEEDVEETRLLQASRQLQSRIGSLEAMSERRDDQIQKMVKRLDGAMQMLAAVKDMCGQQRRVIEAQQVAKKALCHDLGWEEELNSEASEVSSSKDCAAPCGAEDKEEEAAHEENREDSTAEIARMMANLLSSSRLTNTAAELSRSAVPSSPTMPADMPSAPLSLAAQAEADEPEPAPHSVSGEDEGEADSDDKGEVDPEEAARAVEQLCALEAEKEHFERLLRESQEEHHDLLASLNNMRSLMSAFGTLDDAEDDAGDDEDDEYDEDDEDYEDDEDGE